MAMARRAARTTQDNKPAIRPRSPAPPPANDNRAPGITMALLAVSGVLAVFAALIWLLLA